MCLWLLITLPNMHRHIVLGIKLPQPQLKFCWRISFYIMVSQNEFIVTRSALLRGSLYENCVIQILKSSKPYHPMRNGITERFSSTLINMFGTLEDAKKHNWKSNIGSLLHAYNCNEAQHYWVCPILPNVWLPPSHCSGYCNGNVVSKWKLVVKIMPQTLGRLYGPVRDVKKRLV